MSILDMAGQFLGGQEQGGNQNIISEVMSLVNNHPGGIAGLVQSFEQGGLGAAANSWVSNGENQPVTGEQVQNVLGDEKIQGLASKLGVSPETASSHLAQFLPMIINQLTPNGELPAAGAGSGGLLSEGMNLLSGLAKAKAQE